MSPLDSASLDERFRAMVAPGIGGFSVELQRPDGSVHRGVYGDGRVEEASMIRWYSQSKVWGGTLLALAKHRGYISGYDDLLETHLLEFAREFSVIVPVDAAEEGAATVMSFNKVTQKEVIYHYRLLPADRKITVKDVVSESAGIGYEQWAEMMPDRPDTHAYGIAHELRQTAAGQKLFYASTSIVGSEMTTREWASAVVTAGVLVAQPGELCYGNQATVLSYLLETLYNKHEPSPDGAWRPLSAIAAELLFRPLGLSDAAFFLPDGDVRAERVPGGWGWDGAELVDHQALFPNRVAPSHNAVDHMSGPRVWESFDTGLVMPLAEYGAFIAMLLRKGLSREGTRIIPEDVATDVTSSVFLKGRVADFYSTFGSQGLDFFTNFSMGWAVTRDPDSGIQICTWGGYASTGVFAFPEYGAYVIIAPQVYGYGPHPNPVPAEVKGKALELLISALRSSTDKVAQ